MLLVDANNIIHRSYHALINTNLRGTNGEPTWAIHGLVVALARNLKESGSTKFVLAFDSPEKSVRKNLHPFYKGTRKPAPEELSLQLEQAYQTISDARLGACRVPGWEADDIIASAINDNDTFYILSSDRDAHQLLASNVSIIKPESGFFGEKEFEKKYNFKPELYRFFAALVGETSDNIDGVKGIGERTALKIIQSLNSPERLTKLGSNLEMLREVLSTKQLSLLENGVEIYYRNISINTLNRDLNVVKNFSGNLNPNSYRPPLEALNLRKAITLLDSLNQSTLF